MHLQQLLDLVRLGPPGSEEQLYLSTPKGSEGSSGNPELPLAILPSSSLAEPSSSLPPPAKKTRGLLIRVPSSPWSSQSDTCKQGSEERGWAPEPSAPSEVVDLVSSQESKGEGGSSSAGPACVYNDWQAHALAKVLPTGQVEHAKMHLGPLGFQEGIFDSEPGRAYSSEFPNLLEPKAPLPKAEAHSHKLLKRPAGASIQPHRRLQAAYLADGTEVPAAQRLQVRAQWLCHM